MLMKKRRRRAGSRVLTVLLAAAMLVTTLPPAAFAAGNRSSGSIDDMTALDALGIDTSIAPSGYDENDPSNPYGQDQTTMAVVDELLAIGGKNGTLYGHNSPLLGDEKSILSSGSSSSIAGDKIKVPASYAEDLGQRDPSADGSTYYSYVTNSNDTDARAAFYNQPSWSESPWSIAVEGNFSTDNDGQKKQTAVLYAMPGREDDNYFSSEGNPYNQTLKLNLNIVSPTDGKHTSIYTGYSSTAMSKGDLKTSIIINQNGGNMGEITTANIAKMRDIMTFKNTAAVMNHLKLTAGDFDGDGIDEIAFYTPFYSDSPTSTNYPSILVYDLQKMDGDNCFDEYSWKCSKVIALESWASGSDSTEPNKRDIAPNMVSISAADFDKDGTDDLAVSYGYYGTYGEKPTKTSVYLGGRAGEMLTQNVPLNISGIFRTGLATGDVDGDDYNELVIAGSSRNASDKVRYIGVYEWNGSSFVLSSEKNIEIFKKENDSYIYDAAKQRQASKKAELYYSSGAASANVAVGKFNGLSEPACIYVDGLIVELGDSGLDLTRMTDDQLGGHLSAEFNARAVDLNGDGADQLVVSYIDTLVVPDGTPMSFQTYIDKRIAAILGGTKASTVQTSVIGASSPIKTWNGTFSAPNTDNDTTLLTYNKQHYYTYSDPEILAVLASPPYFEDLDQSEYETVDPNSTSYGSSKGSGSGSSYSNSFSAGVYTSWEHDVKIFNVTLFSTEMEAEINNHFTWETEQVSSVEYSAEYQTYAGQDTVVLYTVPVETYVYTAQVPVTDSNGNFKEYETQTMTVNIPHEPTIKTLTLDDYETIAADYEELPSVDGNLLTHTMGDPSSYPSSVNQVPAASFLTTGQPTLVAPSLDEPAPSTGYSTASQTRSIEMTSEKTNSFNYEIEVNTKAGVGAGGVMVGVTAGYSHGAGTVNITTSGSSYSGTIFDIPKSAQDYGYGFSWRLCAFPAQTPDGKIFPVVTYLVTEVDQPSKLPDEFAQSEDGTTEDQIALTWDDAGNPAGYIIYRYFRSAGASDFYEVAYISSSDPDNYEFINGARHYKYIDKGLSSDTEYQYRIQTVGASNGTKSVPSEAITAYTKPAGKIPVVSVTPVSATAYPDTPATLTALIENEDALSGAKISYQWQKLGDDGRTWNNLTGSTAKQNSYVIRNAGQDNAGFYRCRVTSQQDQTIVSSYTDKVEVKYAKQKAVLKGLKVSGGTASVKVTAPDTNSIPTGVVVFTLTGSGFSKDIAVKVDSSGNASATLTAAKGVYKVTAAYNGSRVFGSASTDENDDGIPVFFVSGDISTSGGSSYINMESTYTYGDELNIHKYTVNSDGSAVDEGEIDYSKAEFGRYFTLSYEDYSNNRTGTMNAVLKFNDTGDELVDDSIWYIDYVSSSDGQRYSMMYDAVDQRFKAGYAAFTGTIVMYYDGEFYTFDVSKKDADVGINFSDLPESIPYKDAISLISNSKFTSGSRENILESLQDRTVLTDQPDFDRASKYGNDYDIMFAASSNGFWDNLRDTNSRYVRLNYTDFYPIKEGSKYSPDLYRQTLGSGHTYSLAKDRSYGFYDIDPSYGLKLDSEVYVDNSSYYLSVYDCYNFTVNSDSLNLVANTYDVRTTAEKAGGQVAGTLSLASPSSSLTSFPAGTTLVFSAQPYDGYVVDRWEVNGSVVEGNDTNKLILTQTTEGADVHVFFKVQQNTLTYSASPADTGTVECVSAGTAITSGSVPSEGASLTFTAKAKEGYHFTGWEYFPESQSADYPSDETFTVKMPGTSVRVYAKFARDTYKLDISKGLAAYDADGKQISDLDKITGDSMITVRPDSGYKLAENASWNVTGSAFTAVSADDANAGIKITLTTDTSVTADVAAGKYNIALVQAAAGGSASASASGEVAGGTSVTFTASPERGYKFSGWSDGSSIVSSDTSYTFTAASDITLTPVFAAQTGKTLTISAGSNGMIQWYIDGVSEDAYENVITLYPGETAYVTAIPDTGYMVSGWTGDGQYSDIDDTEMSYDYDSLLDEGSVLSVAFKPVMNHIVQFSSDITATVNGVQISSGNVIADGSTVVFNYSGPKVVTAWKNGEKGVGGQSPSFTIKNLRSDVSIWPVLSEDDGEVCEINVSNSYYCDISYEYEYPLGDGALKGTGVTIKIVLDPDRYDNYKIESVKTDKADQPEFDYQNGTWLWRTKSLDVDLNVTVDLTYSGNTIKCGASEHGTVTALPEKYAKGDSVALCTKAENGYKLDKIEYNGILKDQTVIVNGSDFIDGSSSLPYVYKTYLSSYDVTATFKELAEGAYTITFDQNYDNAPAFTWHTYGSTDGSKAGLLEYHTKDDSQKEDLPAPVREGYTLDGWFDAPDGGDQITRDTVFTDHTTVYAHWSKSDDPMADPDIHIVNISECDGGSVTSFPSKAREGDTVLLSAVPDEGYELTTLTVVDDSGNDITLIDGDSFTMPAGDVTVNAVFTPDQSTAYRVRFDANGGSPSMLQRSVNAAGKIIDFPADPVREGYTFAGWFTSRSGGTEITADTKIIRNMTVYAKWTLNEQPPGPTDPTEPIDPPAPPVEKSFTITFETNGGDSVAAVTEKEGSSVDLTKYVPLRSGYTFGGWFTDSELKNKAADSITLNADMMLYAKWSSSSSGGGGGGSSSGGSGGSSSGGSGSTTPAKPADPSTDSSGSKAEISNVTDFTGKKIDTITDKNGSVTVKTGSDKDTLIIADIKNGGPGTAAYIIKSDGTEELIRDSVLINGKLYMSVPDGAVIKAVDKSTDFTDVDDDSWSADAIAFVSGHGLFNGTSADKFSPAAQMTREMLMTVIARLNGADTSGDALAKGMEWAVKNGISDGSDPKGLITREQIATMLYRNAGKPDVTYNSSHLAKFSDASEISAYAEKAILWAVEAGIINGTNDSRLMPRSNATREQVAQMMLNYVTSLYR